MLDESARLVAADALAAATARRRPIPPLTDTWADFDVEDAYAVQAAVIAQRLAAGDRRVGWKIGLTSIAMQEQLGVDQPDYGPLLASMEVADGGHCPTADLIAPRVEGELAFRLARRLEGPNVTEEQVLAATAMVVPSLEIIDSRIVDWRIKLADTIADHASSARFAAASHGIPPADVDLRQVTLTVVEDGEPVARGRGDAVLGHPARAVAWLARTLYSYGDRLEAGDVILAGAVHASIAVRPGATVTASLDGLAWGVSVRFGARERQA